MRLLAVVTAITLGVAAPAVAEPAMKAVHLGWKLAPTVREMGRQFPAQAKQQKVTRAAVTVDCESNAFGNLDCKAVQASPAELGFGEAAVAVMSRARVRSTDELSPEGRRFTYRVWFGAWSDEERAAVQRGSALAAAAPTTVAAAN